MKRSEMIDKMSEVLEQTFGQDVHNYKIAKDILKIQEEEGMLTPLYEKWSTRNNLEFWTKVREWEPEDGD